MQTSESPADADPKVNLVETLGLSRPYAWSNRYAPADAVIADALLHPVFEDLVKLTLHFGIDRMHAVKGTLVAEGELGPIGLAGVERMLTNIDVGLESSRHPRDH